MVLDGLPHDISLTTAYGFHLWPELPVGSVGLVEGPLMAAVDGITLHVECAERGPQHGTKAEAESVDAITVLLDVYDELRRHMRRRALSRVEPWTLQVGRIRAGEKPNSVARAGTLFGTLRTLDDTSRAEALTFLKSTLDATCLKHGIGVRGRLESATNIRPHLVNDDAAVNKMRTAAAASGVRALRYPEQPLGISEDFGWYLTRCPGAFMLVGCTSPGADVRHLHQPDFDFDETAMLLSVHILTALATEVQQASD
jgi:amidohydrolase